MDEVGSEVQNQGVRRAQEEDQTAQTRHSRLNQARPDECQSRGCQQQDQGHNPYGLRVSEHRQPDRPCQVEVFRQ